MCGDVRLSMSGETSNPEPFPAWLLALPSLLLILLHVRPTAVGVGAQHLATEKTQHGSLSVVPIHHMIGTPDWRRRDMMYVLTIHHSQLTIIPMYIYSETSLIRTHLKRNPS